MPIATKKKRNKKSADSYHHGDLRRALVDTALKAIERGDVEDLSLRAVGRAVGVSPRAPYRHFATKEELLAAVAVEGFRAFESFASGRVAAAGSNAAARLRAVAEAYVLFAVEHPGVFRVMYAPYAAVSESAPELLRTRAEGQATLLGAISGGQEAGLLRAGDPVHLSLALWSTMHGLSVLLVEGQLGRYDRPVSAERLATLVMGMLFEGLGRRT